MIDLRGLMDYPFMIFIGLTLSLATLILIQFNFVKFKNKFEMGEFIKSRKTKRKLISFTRVFTLILLCIALASPFITKETQVKGEPILTMVIDNSTSMNVYDMEKILKLKSELENKIPVITKYSRGSNSPIGNNILANIKGGDNLLVVTDGNSNSGRELGEIMEFAASINSTISSIMLETEKKDASVYIEGPDEVISGSEANYKVIVKGIGGQGYQLNIKYDGNTIEDKETKDNYNTIITQKVGTGYHVLSVKINNGNNDDYFTENNQYFKVIEGLPKPKVLYVSKRNAPLLTMLKQVYEVKETPNIPDSFEGYDSVIFNDLKYDDVKKSVELITNYLTDGGGLFVVGGEDAFEGGDYKNSVFETMLPVKTGMGEREKEEDVNVVILIDVSQSTGRKFSSSTKDSKVDVEKSLAIGVVESLKIQDKVAIVAFNTEGFLISELSILNEKSGLEEKIASLQDGGGTVVLSGLQKAYEQLARAKGSKNIILISDGVTLAGEEALNFAQLMNKEGVKIYTVGVGTGTNAGFLRALAGAGGTDMYFEPEQTQKIKVIFGEESEEQKKKPTKALFVMNNNHFITRDLDLSASISGWNFVLPKSSAQLLVSTSNNNPVLVSWRYGLGRVAVLATDDATKWSGELLSRNNSALIVRTVNWVCGDISKNQEFSIKTKNLYANEENELIIYSDKPIESELKFSKISKNTYRASYFPKEAGIKDVLNGKIAVNYQIELKDIGVNPEWEKMVTLTKGKMFKTSQIDEIVEKVKSDSTKSTLQKIYLRWPFIFAAILFFLIDIAIRRPRPK